MNAAIKRKMGEVVGENLDNLLCVDWRGSGFLQPLYRAAREQCEGPLTMTAAGKCIDRIKEGDVVFILTGFPVGPFDVIEKGKVLKKHDFTSDLLAPETDGVVAAALVARAMDLGFNARPVIFCEEECVSVLRACCAAAGLNIRGDSGESAPLEHVVTVRGFSRDPKTAAADAERILKRMRPAAAVSIERPGRNEKGAYHMANGRAITEFTAKIDELFEGAARSGSLTIGIGDIGNELGMGLFKEATRRIIPYGNRCRCGCGGGIGAAFKAEATILGSISEDAAYAFLACLAYLLEKPELLQTTEMETRILQAACDKGAIDGPSGLSVPRIDLLDVKIHNHMIELMREMIESPKRFFDLQPFFYGDFRAGQEET